MRYHWPWDQRLGHGQAVSQLDITKVALSVVAGVGAAIALTVTYRRQRDAERSRLDERFAASAAQLAGASPAECLAGMYAIATMADETPERRQQCINLLCAYLRLPYDPAAGLLSTVVVENTWPAQLVTRREQRTYQCLPNDREVRLTIIDVIRAHLQIDAPVAWHGYDFDFTGAVFNGGNFRGAQFTGGTVNFSRSQFTCGDLVSFDGAAFTGGLVNFAGAQFAGGDVYFFGAEFTGGLVNFGSAEVTGGLVTFNTALFIGSEVNFPSAHVIGGEITFISARFIGGLVTFHGTHFDGGQVTFDGALFSGGTVGFKHAKFAGGEVHFDPAAMQAPSPPDLSGAIFDEGDVGIGKRRLTEAPPARS